MMRKRNATGAMAIGAAACAIGLIPAAAQAVKHPSPNGLHRVSINVSENPVVAGDQLAIWGQLRGSNNGNRAVTLWHRINPAPNFTPVQTVQTDANGFYAIFRPQGIVNSNRNWYVKATGARSRTIHEKVFSLVSLSGPADGSTLLTGPAHKTTFTGTVSPGAAGERVFLQRQNSSTTGRNWHTIDRTRLGSGGSFTIVHTFRVPGDANIRVLVPRTRRHLASPSNVLGYQISQAQNPALTLSPSADPIQAGQPLTLTGTLASGAGQQVMLFARSHGGQFAQVGQTTADGSGNYSFVQTPLFNTLYQARAAGKNSAQVFEGVKPVLTAQASATTVNAGDPVQFTGTVTPDKTGHVIYLQRQNPSGGGFHTVQVAFVGTGSTYSISRRLFVPGTKAFRVFIPGGPFNQGAASPPLTITVNPSSAQSLNGDQPDQTSTG
ncbi:MAG: hypothetical protein QOF37_1091 [Thermoleophilaceae bacterium]|nr:hypothetical protein [Thermoleophilaceae bacterium]